MPQDTLLAACEAAAAALDAEADQLLEDHLSAGAMFCVRIRDDLRAAIDQAKTQDAITLTRDQVRQLAEEAIREYLEAIRDDGSAAYPRAVPIAVNAVVEAAFAARATPEDQSHA